MAEAKLVRDSSTDNRIASRTGVLPGTTVQVELVQGRLSAELLDFSLEGCGLLLPAGADSGISDVQVHLATALTGGADVPSQCGRITNRSSQPDGRVRCGVQFDSPLPQSAFGLAQELADKPLLDTRSRRQRFLNQRALAFRDLEDLRASSRQIQLMQLQLLLTGVPVLLALLWPSYSFLLGAGWSASRGTPPWWILLLPLGCLFLSFAIFGIYLRLAGGFCKHESFLLLLERAVAEASFPPAYRGWSDASCNLQQRTRRAAPHDSLAGATRSGGAVTADSPALPLLRATTITFLVTPVFAALAMWLLAVELGIGLSPYTVLVALSTFLLVLFSVGSLSALRRVKSGDRSFGHYLHEFTTILAQSPFYTSSRRQAS